MTGIEIIAAERQRQIEIKKYTAKHDDTHIRGELSGAATTYALFAHEQVLFAGDHVLAEAAWWPGGWVWEPTVDPIQNLAKAGALIAAEIDRLLRKQNAQ